jgi:hypothetical protein
MLARINIFLLTSFELVIVRCWLDFSYNHCLPMWGNDLTARPSILANLFEISGFNIYMNIIAVCFPKLVARTTAQ